MSLPDFDRAQYVEPPSHPPQTIEGYSGDYRPGAPADAFPRALLYGFVAAVVGSVGYALVGLSGWMVSIVAIAVAYLIAKAMMTASGGGGVGGRRFQVAAVVLTYLAVSFADVLDLAYYVHRDRGFPYGNIFAHNVPLLLKITLFGPFLQLGDGINGILGLVILAIGMRSAWRLAAGSPGFGRTGGPRVGVFG